jgi:hypothetical protein
MLTAIPARALHAIRDAVAAVLVLADLGLELLCGEHDHSGALEALSRCPDVLPEWMTA